MLDNEITSNYMTICKKCGSNRAVKSGIIAERQRFRCKDCGCNFRFGDKRTNEEITAKKTLSILLYSLNTYSYRMLGKLLQTDHTLIHRWIREFGNSLPEPKTSEKIKQLTFDELWYFLGLTKETSSSLKQLIITHKDLLPDCLIDVLMQHLADSH
jgi:transposase-like protein